MAVASHMQHDAIATIDRSLSHVFSQGRQESHEEIFAQVIIVFDAFGSTSACTSAGTSASSPQSPNTAKARLVGECEQMRAPPR